MYICMYAFHCLGSASSSFMALLHVTFFASARIMFATHCRVAVCSRLVYFMTNAFILVVAVVALPFALCQATSQSPNQPSTFGRLSKTETTHVSFDVFSHFALDAYVVGWLNMAD
ncbi:unnamed protein product [Ceratitis capitata]|uniref:(Mediterranean fruit fly) hypothetical protein n=1 Tax=Ceratitis capitata TaxID=7213 RepID=A0A811U6H0_CERCA|nr:unnamed protein product [Ceratitis capitata]